MKFRRKAAKKHQNREETVVKPMFEAVCSDDNSSFRALHFSCARFSDDHTWHCHPEYELAYVVSSEGTRFVGDSIQRYEPGDLVLLGPNLPHCWSDEQAEGTSTLPELIVLQFTHVSFGEGFLNLAEAQPLKHLLERCELGLHFAGKAVGQVGALMRSAVQQQGLERMLSVLRCLNILTSAPSATPLATEEYKIGNTLGPATQKRMDSIYRYIRENLDGGISQAGIAKSMNMTAAAFSRFFKAATGKTFVAFVNTLRINEACRRLNQTDESITEIAFACGYNNMSNFNRQFLTIKGMNPSAYRSYIHKKSDHHSHYLDVHVVH
jgi:AraC-like DNA-binding protein/quercetin dioxygenase-like cupin family protein